MNALLQQAKIRFARARGIADLLWFGWRGTLAAIVGGLVLSFFLFGFWWPYWTVADMDFWMVYGGFLHNDGLPKEYFDHPTYLGIVLLGEWLRALHGLGLIAVDRLSQLPPPADAAAAWTDAMRAGRVLSLLLAIAFILAFAALMRRLVGEWRIAAIGALLLTYSGGLMMQARVMRSELIPAALVTSALLILLICARTERTAWRPLAVGLAGLLTTLALLNKVQFLFLICALPLLVIPFGVPVVAARDFWRQSPRARWAGTAIVTAAILLLWTAWPIAELGLRSTTPTEGAVPLPGLHGYYQAAIAVWIGAAMAVFARLYRVSPLETAAAMAALVGGLSLGWLALLIEFHPQTVWVVFNPIEQMSNMIGHATVSSQGNLITPKLFGTLFDGFTTILAKRTFVLNSSARPTIFLEWAVIAGAVYAWRTGRRPLALQIALMLAVVWGVDTISAFRGLKLEYFIITDPITVIAACLLLAGLPELHAHRRTFQIGAALIVAHVVVSHAEPVKHTLRKTKPAIFCQKHTYYTKRVETFPYCLQPQ